MKGLPASFQVDVDAAVAILQKHGAKEIYLFGSLATGEYSENSDIDMAVRGIDPAVYLQAYADLSFSIERRIDLLNMETQERFSAMLFRQKELIRVA